MIGLLITYRSVTVFSDFLCDFRLSRSVSTAYLLTVVSDEIFSVIETYILQASILGRALFILQINDLIEDVICNIGISADILLSTLSKIKHLICGIN